MRKIALLLSVAIAAIGSTTAFAGQNDLTALRDVHNLPAKFDSNTLLRAAGETAIGYIIQEYGVDSSFTEADIIRLGGEKTVNNLRKRYSIGPNFTCADLRRAIGAQNLTAQMELLNLSRGFTENDYVMALGRFELKVHYDTFFRNASDYPKDSVEYGERRADAAIKERMKVFSELPANFTYQQYRKVVGPVMAAWFRRAFDIEFDASHSDIRKAIADRARAEFAAINQVSVDWKLDEFIKALGEKRLNWMREGRSVKGPINEASIAGAYSNDILDVTVPQGDCTEADIARVNGERAAESVRVRYDLEKNFTDADVREAAGLSAIADVRLRFGVGANFTSQDLEEAQARLDAK
jgi:hypothetical protein